MPTFLFSKLKKFYVKILPPTDGVGWLVTITASHAELDRCPKRTTFCFYGFLWFLWSNDDDDDDN